MMAQLHGSARAGDRWDGDARTDQSIYLVGYAYRPRRLLRMRIALQGLSLARRAVEGDLQAAVDQRWASARR